MDKAAGSYGVQNRAMTAIAMKHAVMNTPAIKLRLREAAPFMAYAARNRGLTST
jgi:hypothetical protein